MNEVLQEIVSSRGAAMGVDRAAGVIRGVKLLGLESRNGRRYLPEALRAAASLYEGAKVNINHSKGNPLAARDYQDRIGTVKQVAFRDGAGLFGNLHYNPKHVLAEQLVWDAENAAENVGFSHNVLARTSRQQETVVVDAILQVNSVDLVADPATTRGLFESNGDTVAAENVRLREELAETRRELDELKSRRAVDDRRSLVKRLLAEHRLPDPDSADANGQALVSPAFLETVFAAPDEAAMRRLMEDRAWLVRQALGGLGQGNWGHGKPVAREQQSAGLFSTPQDAASFAAAIKI
jgi:hypothetical protein